jgi:hypothetical protein
VLKKEPSTLTDAQFNGSPAKWAGHAYFLIPLHFNDRHENVKVDYGVKPRDSYVFVNVPE